MKKKNWNKFLFVTLFSAAQRFPDQMEKEPEKSWKLNVDTTQHLAQAK